LIYGLMMVNAKNHKKIILGLIFLLAAAVI